MSFSTISFLFLFFPVALILYFITPRRLKRFILVLLSLVFYAWGDMGHLLTLGFSVLFNYCSGIEIARWREQEKAGLAALAVWTSALVNLAVLCFYKYISDAMPIGISFFTFSALSYIIDVYKGRAEGEYNIVNMALYICFFPKLISGPIVQYADFREQLGTYQPTRASVYEGAELFLAGLFKKVLLADNLGRVFTAIHGMSAMSAVTAWLGMIFYSLQLYYDFSGYSDMAIGLARMLGFRIGKNFDYPYRSLNVSEFWRRWHISLGAWFREYVYIPLGGNRHGDRAQIRNFIIVWLLTGIWHGSTMNFVVWGLWHGMFIILERFVFRDGLDRWPRGLRIFLTDLVVFVGWVFFFSPSLGGALRYLGLMLGGGHMGFWDRTATYYLANNLLLLAAAVICSGPLVRTLHENLVARLSKRSALLPVLVYGALLVFCIAGMVNATYSSFLYFQF